MLNNVYNLGLGFGNDVWKMSRNEQNQVAFVAAVFANAGANINNNPSKCLPAQQEHTAHRADDVHLLGSPMDIDIDIRAFIRAPNPLSTRLSDYTLRSGLGKGAFGEVYLAESDDGRGGSASFALKVVRRAGLTSETSQNTVYTEQKIMKKLTIMGSPFFPRLRESFVDGYNLYFAMEMVPGGTLRDFVNRNRGRLTQYHIRLIIAELVYAVSLLHDDDIIHRDLKPDNVLIDENGHMVIVDFGLARYFENSRAKASNGELNRRRGAIGERITQTHCGTLGFIAPEVFSGFYYAFEADMWSIGCIAYELTFGILPFPQRDEHEHVISVIRDEPSYPSNQDIDPLLVDLLRRLLDKSQVHRITAGQARGHEFFKGIDWEKIAKKSYNLRQSFTPKRSRTTEKVIDKQKLVDERLAYQDWFVSNRDRTFVMLPNEVAAAWESPALPLFLTPVELPESVPLLKPTAHRLGVGRRIIDVLERARRLRQQDEFVSVILNSPSGEHLIPKNIGSHEQSGNVNTPSYTRFSSIYSTYGRAMGITSTNPVIVCSRDESSSPGLSGFSLFDQSIVAVEEYVPLASSTGPTPLYAFGNDVQFIIDMPTSQELPVLRARRSGIVPPAMPPAASLSPAALAVPGLTLSGSTTPSTPMPQTPTSQTPSQPAVKLDIEDPFADPIVEIDYVKDDSEWLGELSMDISEMESLELEPVSWHGELSMDISESGINRDVLIVVHSRPTELVDPDWSGEMSMEISMDDDGVPEQTGRGRAVVGQLGPSRVLRT